MGGMLGALRRRMKKQIALFPLLASACATVPVADPVIPAKIDEAQAVELYEAHKLVCTGGECQQGDEVHDIEAFERTRLDMPRQVLRGTRHTRNAISWVLFGGSIASAIGSSMSFLFSDASPGDTGYRTRGFALAGGAAASLLVGLLVRSLWPQPTETFESAYNRALAIELKKRVVGDPTALQAPRELTATEKECIRRKSSSPVIFEKFDMNRCIAKRTP